MRKRVQTPRCTIIDIHACRILHEDLASGRSAAEAAKEADARREANRRRREEEAAAEVKNPVLVRPRACRARRPALPSGASRR